MDQDQEGNTKMKMELISKYLALQDHYNELVSKQEDQLLLRKKEKIKRVNLLVSCLKLGIRREGHI